VVGDGRAAERDPFSDIADIQLSASKDLDQVLAHRIRECDQQVATERQVIAERPHLRVKGAWIDQLLTPFFCKCVDADKRMTQITDPDAIHDAVRTRYAAAATAVGRATTSIDCCSDGASCCGSGPDAREISSLLYSIDEVGELPLAIRPSLTEVRLAALQSPAHMRQCCATTRETAASLFRICPGPP
jgi:hypothetical protein